MAAFLAIILALMIMALITKVAWWVAGPLGVLAYLLLIIVGTVRDVAELVAERQARRQWRKAYRDQD